MNEHPGGFTTPGSERGSGHDKNIKQKRWILISSLVIIVAVSALWIGKQIQIRNLKNESAKMQERIELDAKQAIIQSHEQHLRLLAKPFVWAVREEMMRNNANQINLYTNEMIREKNISSIMVVNASGKIISSTNKKWEGRDYLLVGDSTYVQSDTTIVDNIKDSILIMSSPVMGFNNRLGTLIIHYALSTPRVVQANK
jgi:hypothetical protein